MDEFFSELCARKVPRNDGLEKLSWGYSNTGNFNLKQALGLVTGTQNIELEAKWGKIWGGGWWPKVMTFCWLVLERCILT